MFLFDFILPIFCYPEIPCSCVGALPTGHNFPIQEHCDFDTDVSLLYQEIAFALSYLRHYIILNYNYKYYEFAVITCLILVSK